MRHLMQRSRTCLGLIATACILGLLVFAPQFQPHIAYGQNATVSSVVPPEYRPNYHIQNDREPMLDKFIQIQAVRNTGGDLDEGFFQQLNTHFKNVFPKLPQKNNFKITYTQCELLASSLASSFSNNKFGQFIEGCYSPLDKAIKEMNSKYTMKAKILANPNQGAAPLTVTFDARNTSDPSNDTIPTAEYYWYFKDTRGVDRPIGTGPLVNYTFDEPGNYVIHLTVRSANQASEGILDGSSSTNINVGPQAATMIVYANGLQLDDTQTTKMGTTQVIDGLQVDGSATAPKGGRVIQEHTWVISAGKETLLRETNPGRPGIILLQVPEQGTITVSLQISDNENNTMTQDYQIIIADPLAVIKQNPEQGTSSTRFTFDASSSYAVQSKLRVYTRDVYDSEGQKIDSLQGKKITKEFPKPGTYIIQLTVEDEQGRRNQETTQLMIESTPPTAQFTMEEMYDRDKPSQYRFDASLSSDPDTQTASDELIYQRDIEPQNYITVNDLAEDAQQVVVSFNEPADYEITLKVTDAYNQSHEITKKLKIESSLRPQLFMSPKAAPRGANVKFLAKANKPVVSYRRDFGDGTIRETSNYKMIHQYEKTGIYPVTLTTYGTDDEVNSITRNVYAGERGKPVLAYKVKSRSNILLKQEDSCTPTGEELPAYRVARFQQFSIDIKDSVDTKGQKRGLLFYFQPQNDDIFRNTAFNYKFVELGCQYIDIRIEDETTNQTDKQRVWFNVVNDLPTLQNLAMVFPQYGNNAGISLMQNQQSSKFTDDNLAPLIVKLSANNARDPDGAIAFYKRYYFNKDNPDRILEKKITPANIPEAYFTLQRIPGDYEFGLTIVDNDGGEQDSKNIIGHGPSVFFPPDNNNLDIPIVTLKQSAINTKVGQDVTFEVVAKILSDRSDFAAIRSIQYDFDGDGTIDLTTKKDTVDYYYPEAGTYTPRVKVLYRGIPGTAIGETINVDAGIRPLLITEGYQDLVLVRDISIGTDPQSQICMDITKCSHDIPFQQRDPNRFIQLTGLVHSNKSFAFRYPSASNYTYELFVTDQFANQVIKTGTLTVPAPNTPTDPGLLYPLTIPQVQSQGDNYSITLGEQLHNTVSYFLVYDGPGKCFMDTDITFDTNGDADPKNDKDISCNELEVYEYKPLFDTVVGRIVYDVPDPLNNSIKTQTTDITVHFIENLLDLDQDLIPIYQEITATNLTLDTQDLDLSYLQDLLLGLRDHISDQIHTSAQVITIRDYVATITDKLSETQRNRIDNLLFKLSDSTVTAAMGGTAYEQAKQDIILLVPTNVKTQVSPLFGNIENAAGDQKVIKQSLQDIINIMRDNTGPSDTQIDPLDIDLIIMPKICQIINYYEISSKVCKQGEFIGTVPPIVNGSGTQTENGDGITSRPTTDATVNNNTNNSSGGLPSILKRILIIVILLALIFGAMVAVFAIKARLAAKDEQTEATE